MNEKLPRRTNGATLPQQATDGTLPRQENVGTLPRRRHREFWRPNWRKEMLYLSLATMESCWFYAWLAFILGTSRQAPRVPRSAILFALVLALYLTRLLSQRAISLLTQRVVTIVLALLSTVLLLKLYVYVDYHVSDLSWLGRFVWEISNTFQRIHASLVIFLAGLYLWWRGIQLAQRDLGVASVSFSFRVGIIAFLWLFLLGILGFRIDATPSAFAYFFLALIALGLARIEEVSHSRLGIRSPFNASWMGILSISALAVSALSMLAARVFSLGNISAAVNRLRPVVSILGKLASPALVAIAWLLELVLSFLIRVFSAVLGARSQEPTPLGDIAEQLLQFQQARPAQGMLLLILQLIKWGFLVLLFASALAVLAFSISRFRGAREAERSAEHESVWDSEGAEKDLRDALGSRWRRWREQLQTRLARLRGEEYSLVSVREVYASLVRLAGASGLPRHEAETPYEYVATLHKAFPNSSREIRTITSAYVRAHYGERSFRPEYVQRVRDAWLTIRTRHEQDSRS